MMKRFETVRSCAALAHRRFFSTTEKLRGFVEIERTTSPLRDPVERIKDYREIHEPESSSTIEANRKKQAARCMDCGTPFCQTETGCPVHNLIPEWNELVHKSQWKDAVKRLHKTNNFPEFTGRVCPAPCESSCVAGLVEDPVTIKDIEYAIAEKGWKEGWIKPNPPLSRTGMSIGIIGSGPSGLAAADQLNRQGHSVTVYEREDSIGGLLTYGIPNMKLSKDTVRRRVDLMTAEGIEFVTNAHVGVNIPPRELLEQHDSVVLAVGSTVPIDVPVPGRDLDGIHFAMEFLTENQKRLFVSRDGHIDSAWGRMRVDAKGKDVVVIGGGDTGCDCIATSIRHHCNTVTNITLGPEPPAERPDDIPWPEPFLQLKNDYGHVEAMEKWGDDPRVYNKMTKEFISDGNGRVKSLIMSDVKWTGNTFEEVPNTEQEIPADLVLIAIGYSRPEHTLASTFGLLTDKRGNLTASHGIHGTETPGIYVAGDCRRGQSLVVRAIHEGREAAKEVHQYLERVAAGEQPSLRELLMADDGQTILRKTQEEEVRRKKSEKVDVMAN